MELFQPSSLRRTDGSLVHAASSTGLLSTANQAAATRHTPRQINVFGGTTGVGASLFSADPSWTATPSPVAQPPAAAPTSSTPPTGAVAPVSSPSGTTTPATEPAPAPATTPQTAPASPAPAPAPATPVTPVTPVTPTPPPATQGGYTPAQQTIIDSFSNVKDTASYNTWLTSAKSAGVDTTQIERRYNALENEWKDKPWGTASNVFAANTLYSQINGLHGSITQANGGKNYWSGEGYGSLDNNMRAFAQRLSGKVSDLNQLAVKDEPVIERSQFQTNGRGDWYRVGADDNDRSYSVKVTDPALAQRLNEQYQATPEVADEYGQKSKPSTIEAEYESGRVKRLINKETGEVVDDSNGEWKGQDNVFRVGYTTKGKGMVHYAIKMQEQANPQTGEKSYVPVPIATYEDTGAADMEMLGNVLAVASIIPGVAPFAQLANAGLQASQGNWLGAISSGLGAAPGVSSALGAPLSSSTAATLSGVSKGLSAVNALDNGNVLGAISAGAGALDNLNTGLDLGLSSDTLNTVNQVRQGAGLINSLQNNSLAGVISNGANLAGVKEVGGISTKDIAAGANAVQALQSGNYLKFLGSSANLFANDRAY